MTKYVLSLVAALSIIILLGCSEDDSPTKSPVARSISISANSVISEGQTLSVTVILSPGAGTSVSWTIGVSSLSSTAADYAFPVTTVFVGTDTSVFLIPIVDDALAEGSELFQIKASAFTGQAVPADSVQVRIQPSDGGADVGFAASVLPLLNTHCAGCHIGVSAGGLNFGSSPTAASVRDASGSSGVEVFPGLAAQSFLYLKTTTTPPLGDRMPTGGPYLSDTQQNLIRDWINQGCQDN